MEATRIELLVEGFPGFADAIRGAGPAIYRSAIRHGAYPFPPADTAVMTSGVLFVAVAMMTTQEHRYLYRVLSIGSHPHHGQGVLQRRRTEHERRRLMVQSLANIDAARIPIDADAQGSPDDNDDEDLLDILVVAMPHQHPKIGYRRDQFRLLRLHFRARVLEDLIF